MASSTQGPVVSVVVPFYNTAEFLAKCIESVLGQTLSDFELILVDNCSTDGSAEIARQFTAGDSRVLFFQNSSFLTQVQNYNHALCHISPGSLYCKIVQADDLIYPRCLTEMVEFADQNPSVGIVASYRLVGTEIMPARLPHLRRVMAGREAARIELLEGLSLFGTPTSLLVRSEIIRQRRPFYTEGMLFEDTAVVYEILREYDFGFVREVLSFTRLDEESIFGGWQSFQPMALARLLDVVKFGPDFLDDDELREVQHTLRRAHTRQLAKGWLQHREANFWEFHRSGLAEIGETIPYPRLIQPAVGMILGYLLAPRRAAKALANRARYRQNGASAQHQVDAEANSSRGKSKYLK